MSDARYDIIITGKLLDGTSQNQASLRLAKLFNTSPNHAAQLVDGKAHRIKKAVSEDVARKFKGALTKAGLQTVAKRVDVDAPAASASTPPPDQASNAISLAPEGTPVLTEGERENVVAPALDLSSYSLAEMEPWEGEERPAMPELDPPDFGLAEAGAVIDTLPDTREKLNPDTSALSLDEPGARLGAKPKPAPPAPDTDHIKLEKRNPFL
ncbi:hypothetical protein FHR99_001111 [Litorivivens lipolytica]|uniref:Uncharacterized protein n=1 Tax=Litorivivens lipolytica TaxID=1524264 RepID=A0A7W4W3X3_9GAMM|nr:hypothetical protein [Litorivivens lipolytica]MBB3046875.1 hypothetical protein [Litorivivens lipolytica]